MKSVKVKLSGTYIWGGKKYGPGEAVSVPADMAEWLGQSAESAETAEATEDPKPARRKAAE